jgi:protein TonB
MLLELTVDIAGNPVDIVITRPLGFGLDDQAVKAVKSWKFRPATLKGQPVPARVSVRVTFQLYRH